MPIVPATPAAAPHQSAVPVSGSFENANRQTASAEEARIAAASPRARTIGRRSHVGGMVPEDVYSLTGVADPRLSPDGATVAYVVTSIDREDNAYRSSIWIAAMDGSTPPRRIT